MLFIYKSDEKYKEWTWRGSFKEYFKKGLSPFSNIP
jgi:hypothetical protein